MCHCQAITANDNTRSTYNTPTVSTVYYERPFIKDVHRQTPV